MKKKYFFTLLLTLCFSAISFGQVIITELADPNNNTGARFVELYIVGPNSVDFTGWELVRYTNAGTSLSSNIVDLSSLGTLGTGSFAIIAANGTNFNTVFGFPADINAGTGGPADSNGDDKIGIRNSTGTIIDIFGTPGVSSNNTNDAHNFEDGRAERKASVTVPTATWNAAEWNTDNDQGFGSGAQDAPAGYDPKTWIGTTTTPTLTINSPSAGSIPNTTSVTPIITVANFTVSGDNGSGASDGSGDGFIKSIFATQGGTTENANFFSTTLPAITVAPGNTYTLTLELVDNAGASLATAVSKSVTFTVEHPCNLVLGDMATTCDASTTGMDGYSGTIAFTGGNTGIDYTITVPAGVTLGGDDPDTVAAGTITFTGMTEGTNAEIKIVGGANSSCDLPITFSSPTCISFPVIEHFDYTDGANLGDQSPWTMFNSGDQVLIANGNLDYTGLEASTGNLIKFDESGSETSTAFSDVTSGTVYASFLLKVTAFQTGSTIDVTDGGYIASLAGSTNSYDARFWVRPNPDTTGTTFDIGYGFESSNPTFTTGTYNLNDVLFVVIAYNMDNATVSTWINPDASSFGGTMPTATISGTDTNPPSAINLFVLRQDSSNETPFVELDALRISNSWADVTPKEATASLNDNSIDGFTTYPNPITDKRFTISSTISSLKQVAIFNVLGKKVFSSSFSGEKKNIDVSGVNAGIYILKVTENGKTATKKLVIR